MDHWNTDNPHIHVLVRGRADDGQDLVISRDYISNGFRGRAGERVTLELGLRSEHEIRASLEKEFNAERWTSLDRSLRDIADEGGGVADLRPAAAGEDHALRQSMVGRAAKLERLGLAEQVRRRWTWGPGIRGLARSGPAAAFEKMHRAVVQEDATQRRPASLHGDEANEPVLGRLLERGLQNELKPLPRFGMRCSLRDRGRLPGP